MGSSRFGIESVLAAALSVAITLMVAPTVFALPAKLVDVQPLLDDPNPGNYCTACLDMLAYIEAKGCGYACSALPSPVDKLCGFFLNKTSACTNFIAWISRGVSTTAICSALGLCGSGTCKCGLCTGASVGRCLSLPQICNVTEGPDSKLIQTMHLFKPLDLQQHALNKRVCFNGVCDEDHYGCCVTCL